MAVLAAAAVILALAFAVLIAGQHTALAPSSDENTELLTGPGVAAVLGATATPGEAQLYPDPAHTPGVVLPRVTAGDVCRPGYARSVRAVSENVRRQVFRTYGIAYPPPAGRYELDHLVSLELGGSNDARNLWPELAEPRPGYHEKDLAENDLHRRVCAGKLPLAAAQAAIADDWFAIYQALAPAR